MLKIETNLKESKEVHALIVKSLLSKEDNKAIEVPAAIKPRLQEFQKFISDELPNELPLIYDIKHQIVLIPGVSISNFHHYKMSLKEEILRES